MDKEALACTCDDDYDRCQVHVACDDQCKALQSPGDDMDALRYALEHWRSHSWTYGCAHGN